MNLSRRELLKSAGLAVAASQVQRGLQAEPPGEVAAADWLKTCRTLICEAYNPPFYPSFDYQAEKAAGIARALNADSMRYPAASYFAYFPTKSGYPVHPELKGDPFRETVELCKKNGMKVVAYVPLNHPFMDATSKDLCEYRRGGAGGDYRSGASRHSRPRHRAADYSETRMARLRTYLGSLIDPVLAAHKTYEVAHQSGLMPQLMASRDTILLHLIADTGNKTKKLRIREEFLPVLDVKVRVHVPEGRTVRSVSLMRAGTKIAVAASGGWIELTVPRVLIHEAVRVDLV